MMFILHNNGRYNLHVGKRRGSIFEGCLVSEDREKRKAEEEAGEPFSIGVTSFQRAPPLGSAFVERTSPILSICTNPNHYITTFTSISNGDHGKLMTSLIRVCST